MISTPTSLNASTTVEEPPLSNLDRAVEFDPEQTQRESHSGLNKRTP